jgi:adenylate cyclase
VLFNALPASIAEELKLRGRVEARKFEDMGVLFADLAGFTAYSRGLPPDALVLVLNQVFSAFDALVERHGLEKIKTIGDAYMVVQPRGCERLAGFALELLAELERYNEANGTRLRIRVGLHCGPAVAGVIGVTRFLYDVWGETVNLASRMESRGEPGAVHASEAVQRRLGPRFEFRAREPLEIKGCGRVQSYWLLGPRAAVPLAL